MILIVDIFLLGMVLYVILGLLFSMYFYLKAGKQIDEGVVGTPWHFKLIIFPGVVLFWVPLFLKSLKND